MYIADAARNWRVERLAVIDRLLLRLAVHELLEYPGTPPRVVIDEAIELARPTAATKPRSSSTACSTGCSSA